MAAASGLMRLVTAGLNHRTAPLDVRERAAIAPGQAPSILRYLVGHGGLGGAAVLSTCNRTEFYLMCPDALAGEVVPRLGRYLDAEGREDIAAYLFVARDRAALRHLFRVAAGLESMVVGEVQVLGQLKRAHRLAQEAGSLDARLDFILRRAISAGKRAAGQTALAHAAGNVGGSAVDHAAAVLGGLDGARALVVGAGAVSTLAAQRLTALGAEVLVTSRSPASAAALAGAVGGSVAVLDDLESVAEGLELIVCCTSSPAPVLRIDHLARLQARRGHRPLYIVDVAVPRDVEAGAGNLPGVRVVDIDQLGHHVAGDIGERQRAVGEAERLIGAEVARTMAVLLERDSTGSTISALSRQGEALRRRELERTCARLPGLDPVTRERLEGLTQSLVRKLLHGPIAHLRESAGDPAVTLTLREAFDLDTVNPDSADDIDPR